MSQISKKRINSLDLLKILSIFVVFVHHIMMDMYVVHPMHNLKIFETIIIRPNMNIAMIACAMFVLISGATITINKRDEGIFDFYKRRFIRVLIPFYIAYIIYFVIRVINNGTIFIFGGVPKWRFVFTLMGIDEYLSANGVRTFSLGIGEWFLGCIIICYLLYPLLYKCHKKNSLATFIVMTIYYIWINVNYDKFNFVIVNYMNVLCQIYNFYLGIVLIESKILNKIEKWMLIVTVPIVVFFYLCNKLILISDNFKTTIVVLAIFVSAYIFESFISNLDFSNKVNSFFSRISYEFFLVHHFIIYQVDYMINYRRIGGIATLIVIIFDFLMTIIIAMIVKEISKRIINKLFKK